jgi:hypothetical protein
MRFSLAARASIGCISHELRIHRSRSAAARPQHRAELARKNPTRSSSSTIRRTPATLQYDHGIRRTGSSPYQALDEHTFRGRQNDLILIDNVEYFLPRCSPTKARSLATRRQRHRHQPLTNSEFIMFFQRPKQGEIVNVHLVTGEDIVGAFGDLDADNYTILKPVVPNISMDPSAQRFSVGMLPLRPYLGMLESLTIERNKIVYAVAVNEQMVQLYRQFTSSIVIASPSEVPHVLVQRRFGVAQG